MGKLKELLHDLKEGKVFGKLSALFWVVEFQKRYPPLSQLLSFHL